MRGNDLDLVRNVQMFKDINGMAHGLPVGLAAHDDPDQRLLGALWHSNPTPTRKKRRHYRGGPAQRNEQGANR
jgi:hypothetical protein